MRRREFITLLGGGAATWPLMASAQHAATPVIGYLDPRSPDAAENRLRGFHRGLKDAGYIEGENITIVYRWAEDRVDRLPLLAGELVSRSVAAIVAAGVPTTFAAKAATTTIPIVFLVGNDPVELGLVGSLSRPAGNLTGIDIFTSELAAKRLEVLRDLLPKATRMGVLVNPADAGASDSQLKEIEAAARAMGLQIKVHNADTRAEIDAAFEAMDRDRPDAVFVGTTVFLNGRRVQLAHLSTFYRLPAVYALRDFVEVGGLISYGSDIIDSFRQAGRYVGRVLKGAKPGDLPIVKADKFELVINTRTARLLGLTVPSSLLGRADEIID
ncbi:MAG TPA: ABC transporter substrate-binding protein [Pseudolabrys sp.]|jgi:putative ABC transport system substrate-binding protein|nr:ABC transporter substrate-binding protein [Pseudolabrys sp.]